MRYLRWIVTSPLIVSTVMCGGLTTAAGIETRNWILIPAGILCIAYVLVTVKRELNQTSD